ncbi:MAG: OmpH family outer membrane protein [Deferribacteres bacterium]|nr:OmpH family outer membrane protein [Deferribacteres bacterium]
MRKVFKLPLLAIVFLMLGSTVSAQKIGYLNTTSILAEMSDVKAMRSDLEALKTQLQKQGMAKVEAYNSREAELMKALEAGELSDKQKQAGMDELDVKRKEILALEKEMANKLADKEAELLKPILDRVNKAIAAVAKENGFLFILSEQALLWAAESQDITNLVKAKLSM